ncbi:MAG: tRNA pseudouridine(38-40) synthase TruA [Fibrobacterota bacterium]
MNIRLDIEYDGSLYAGWQVQNNAVSVQSEIEKALATVFRKPIRITGAGRTDTGVHAAGQVANFQVTELPVPLETLRRSLNGLLKEGIAIKAVREVPDDFHARYSARLRTYIYSISKVKRAIDRHKYFFLSYELDMKKVRQAARKLLGVHDFRYFSIATGEKSTICDIKKLEIHDTDDEIQITLCANRFLHKMVRMIVGLLIDIGRGKVELSYIDEVLSGKKVKRKKGFAAPAHGLCLVRVDYE